MSDIKLDLKGFSHVRSDDKTTTLKHDKHGHEITLVHKALSEPSRKQLEALGQSAKAAQQSDDKREAKSDKMKSPSTAEKLEASKEHPAQHGRVIRAGAEEPLKSYGKIKMMAEGGVPEALTPTEDLDQEYSQKPLTEELKAELPSKAEVATKLPELEKQSSMQSTKDLYNQKLSASGQPVSRDDMFGPNGEPPKNSVNPQIWNQVEQSNTAQQQVGQQLEKRDEQSKLETEHSAQQLAHEKAMAQNAINAKLGIPLVADPGAPAPLPSDQIPPQPQQAEVPQPQAQGIATPQAAQPQQQAPNPMQDMESMMKKGYSNQLAGIQQSAAAQSDLGKQQAEVLNKQIQAQNDAKAAYDSSYKELEQERQAHMDDIKNGYIDPNKYWQDHSKVATGIGMILAGFNPTNNPNAAIQFLNKQMEMNLEAQKQNLGAKQNLLSANLRQFGNLKDAMDMTRIMQHDIMANLLAQAAATAQSPMAKAAALKASGELQMQAAPMFQQFAMRRAMMNLASESNQDPSNTAAAEQMIAYARLTNPEMAKEMESRLIPNVGMAKIPVPDNARHEIIAKQDLDKAGQDLLSYSKTHSNILPGTPEYNFGVTKAMAFQQKVREGLLGTVFRESEKPLLEKFVNENPAGAFKAITTQPQLKAILQSNTLGLNTLKQNYGLPQQKTAEEPQFATKNGVKYQKVPGGWKKVGG